MNRYTLVKAIKDLTFNVGIASAMTTITIFYFFIVVGKGSGFILLFLDIILVIFDWLCVHWDWDRIKTLTKENT